MKVLLLGAGRTAHFLVHYLTRQIDQHHWRLTIADFNPDNYAAFSSLSERISCLQLDVHDIEKRQSLVQDADAVISLLPASFHEWVAKDCLEFKKHFFTASYVSDEMRKMQAEIESKNLFFLQETGLDPGIDHMSAMQMLDDIRQQGGKVLRFMSYTGGLMSPDLKGNPWQYKFTWNPEYVVTAGRDGGMYLRDGEIKRIPYHRLFTEIDELEMPGQGTFDAYYNRNSLKYIDEYRLTDVDTVVRYTLRRAGFCKSWHPFVNLGMTDNLHQFTFNENITNRAFLNMFIRKGEGSLEERTAKAIGQPIDGDVMSKLRWLDLFEEKEIPLLKGTSAKFLQKVLEPKWNIKEDEKDAIYMAHVCYFQYEDRVFKRKVYLSVEGQDAHRTAMAKTVGLPLAIAVSQFLKGEIKATGLCVPTVSNIYEPILQELQKEGIQFDEVLEEKEGE